MNIVRWWKLRKVLKHRALIRGLRDHNRELNDVLARKRTVRRGSGEGPSEEIALLGIRAIVARSGIATIAEKLGLSWEEARQYA